MSVLDQSFSLKNIDTVFQSENRKAKVPSRFMSDSYKALAIQYKSYREELNILHQIKTEKRTEENTKRIEELLKLKGENADKQRVQLEVDLLTICKKINSSTFRFCLTEKIPFINGKPGKKCYITGNTAEEYFASKVLTRNVQRVFDLHMSSRNDILTQVKLLLNNNKLPKYIIRTDIQQCFESVPHDKLFDYLQNNTLLSTKSKAFLKGLICNEFESKKDKTEIESGKGLPRGCAVSSYLAELYLSKIDDEIQRRTDNLVYYARYVDDIIMIIVPAMPFFANTIENYVNNLESIFDRFDLKLQKAGDKFIAIDTTQEIDEIVLKEFDFLGYNIVLRRNKPESHLMDVTFGLSEKKIKTIKNRIDKTIIHYNELCKINLQTANDYLFNSFHLLAANTSLNNAKKGVKIGIYYSNQLIDRVSTLNDFDKYLKKQLNKNLNIDVKWFGSVEEKEAYQNILRCKIKNNVNFQSGFNNRKRYIFKKLQFIDVKKSWD